MSHSISPPFFRCLSSLFKIILKRPHELLSKSDSLFSTRGKQSDNVFPPFHHRIIFGDRRKHAACSVPVLLLLRIVVLLPSLIHSIVWGVGAGASGVGARHRTCMNCLDDDAFGSPSDVNFVINCIVCIMQLTNERTKAIVLIVLLMI